ncbi:hypothetical protein JZ751_019675, partial [Albula glossodonta]
MMGSCRVCARCTTLCRAPAGLFGDGNRAAPTRRYQSASVPMVREGATPDSTQVRPFDEIPGRWKSGLASVVSFMKQGGFKNIHRMMVQNFDTFGPIYRKSEGAWKREQYCPHREKIGNYESVNIINPDDASILFKAEGHYPTRLLVPPWISYRDYRNQNYGILLKSGEDWKNNRAVLNREVISPKVQEKFLPLLDDVSQDFIARVQNKIDKSRKNKWTSDFSHELFKVALESVGAVLYGERLGLLQDHIEPEAQHFIDCVSLMFKSTAPMLYIPPKLLRLIGAKAWTDHVTAWDGILRHADKCIQNTYRRMCKEPGSSSKYPGLLATLMMQESLSMEDIKSNVTDLMAGGVDTTSMTLQWTLYELSKQPALQEELRTEITAALASSNGDLVQLLKKVPLVKATVKETLRYDGVRSRLYPVAVSLQRYITEDIVIQNYHIPSGTLVQHGIYAMARDPHSFPNPEKYMPSRWLQGGPSYFRNVGFGFGRRQCIGRRIAEAEMQLFLIHV